jgi:hypothetical protein
MTERTKSVTKQERFTYQWYLPSEKSERPPIDTESGNPDEDIDQAAVGDDSVPMAGPGGAAQEAVMEDPPATQTRANATQHKIYRPKHHAVGMKSSLGVLNFGRSMRIRIVAMAGWSAMAGAGAVVLLTRPGPFPGTQMAELGAVWAGISAFLWIALAKLSK